MEADYVTTDWFRWIIGGLGTGIGGVLGVAMLFRRQLGEEDKELASDLKATRETIFKRLDEDRRESQTRAKENAAAVIAVAKEFATALNAYKLEVTDKYATVAHLHEVETRIVAELRDINGTLKEMLRQERRNFDSEGAK